MVHGLDFRIITWQHPIERYPSYPPPGDAPSSSVVLRRGNTKICGCKWTYKYWQEIQIIRFKKWKGQLRYHWSKCVIIADYYLFILKYCHWINTIKWLKHYCINRDRRIKVTTLLQHHLKFLTKRGNHVVLQLNTLTMATWTTGPTI